MRPTNGKAMRWDGGHYQYDLAGYQARFIDPVEIAYRDARIFAPSGLATHWYSGAIVRTELLWKSRVPPSAERPSPVSMLTS